MSSKGAERVESGRSWRKSNVVNKEIDCRGTNRAAIRTNRLENTGVRVKDLISKLNREVMFDVPEEDESIDNYTLTLALHIENAGCDTYVPHLADS
jgi:hypothetical protein